MSACDCTAECGDDPRIRFGLASPCGSYARLNAPADDKADAARYRYLCLHPDWHFIEQLCQQFAADSAVEFYARLSAEIDKRMACKTRRAT